MSPSLGLTPAAERAAEEREPDDQQYAAALQALLRQGIGKKVELPVELRDDLMLGDVHAARDVRNLRKLGVTAVLNMAGGDNEPEECRAGAAFYPASFRYLAVGADDLENYPLLDRHLAECERFYADCRASGGRLLIHCRQGINRNGAMAMALLLKCPTLPDEEPPDLMEIAYECSAKRGTLCTNKVRAGPARKGNSVAPARARAHWRTHTPRATRRARAPLPRRASRCSSCSSLAASAGCRTPDRLIGGTAQ
jgi:hypothetical protein